MDKASKGMLVVIGFFVIFIASAWINNINFIADSWNKDGLQMREIVSITGVVFAPIWVINGAFYFFEDEVSY